MSPNAAAAGGSSSSEREPMERKGSLDRGVPIEDSAAGAHARRVVSRKLAVSFNTDDDDDSISNDDSHPVRSYLCCGGKNKRSFKPAIPTSEEELMEVEQKRGKNSWQMKTMKVINSHVIQRLLVALLLCDVLILFIELYIDATYPSCKTIVKDAISCCPADCAGGSAYGSAYGDKKGYGDKNKEGYGDGYDKDGYDDEAKAEDDGGLFHKEDDGNNRYLRTLSLNDIHRLLGGGGDGGGYCKYDLVDMDTYKYPAACDDHKHHAVHTAHTVLFSMTVFILSFFLIEILLVMTCLGPKLFFSRFLYVLDLFVVGSSLILECSFKYLKSQTAADLAGLLVVFRLWRFVRIGHGLVASTHEMAAHKMNKLKKYTRALEEEVIRCGGVLPESKWSLGLLEESLAKSKGGGAGGSGSGIDEEIRVEIGGRIVSTREVLASSTTTASRSGSAEGFGGRVERSFLDNE